MRSNHGVDRPSSHRRRVILTGLSALILAGLHAPQARADVLAFSTNVNAQTTNVGRPIDLSSAAGSQARLSFTTPAADLVEITFSAVCSVTGPPSNTVSVAIEVKEAGAGGFSPIAPTAGADKTFCSGDNAPGNLDSLVTVSRTVVTDVPAGTHEVLVFAAPQPSGGPTLRLDDLSITVDS